MRAARGVVVRMGWNRMGGKTVTVFGPAGRFHCYAHLDDWDSPGMGGLGGGRNGARLCRRYRQRQRSSPAPVGGLPQGGFGAKRSA
ncbi:MAG: hypothetical protein ACJ76N_25805 [Thermoanaerobaculia bacterium]